MKALFICLGLALFASQSVMAGGNTSIVEIDKVTSIVIEENKVILKGSALVRFRVMSTQGKGDHRAFGQPAQWVHARTEDAVFEILPYFGKSDITQIPGDGGLSNENQKKMSDDVWKLVLKRAKALKKGDSVKIGYQGNRITLDGFEVEKVEGFGSLQ